MKRFKQCLACIGFLLITSQVAAQKKDDYVKDHFDKTDTLIPVRDGVKLYTVIYTPKAPGSYPILLERTPYSAGPYGNSNYPKSIGPNDSLMQDGYIFVVQDVRGRYMSEGINEEVTPILPKKINKSQTDESSDTYDAVDWLTKNVKNNNGKVGLYGISYPGFYATNSLIQPHPAVKAVSPQAPVTDEFIGDDANHNGAFFLLDNFSFMNYFGMTRTGPTEDYGQLLFKTDIKDAYDFFLKLGPVSTTQNKNFFDRRSEIWNEYLEHDTYDAYWQSRNIRKHLSGVTIPTLVVGGWFDAEDLYGSLKTYEALEKGSANNKTMLVMGPWTHGAWAGRNWKSFASYDFGSNTSDYFQKKIETIFFNYYLKGTGEMNLPEATIYETGTNKWTSYTTWPPKDVRFKTWYLNNNILSATSDKTSFEEYVSDPEKPVPYTNGIYGRRNNDYMAEDQRFAANRTDVLVFESEVLTEDLTLTGAILASLQVSISTTDADFIVKLIDVLPGNETNFKNAPLGFQMAGYQRLVRAEVLRGKFRNSFITPEPFKPNEKTRVDVSLNDVAHTFLKGHKIMVQVQSSWFPLVDRNPQQFLSIPRAKASDFKKTIVKLFGDSKIILPVKY